MGIKSDIEYAIYSHGAWKARFRNFLGGKTGLDLSAVGHTETCKLGKWLADEARRMLSPEDHVKACELQPTFTEWPATSSTTSSGRISTPPGRRLPRPAPSIRPAMRWARSSAR